jgi:hypothetical protein
MESFDKVHYAGDFSYIQKFITQDYNDKFTIGDLGCGYEIYSTLLILVSPGGAVNDVARAFPNCTAWGIDLSLDMIKAAKDRNATLGERVSFYHGDVKKIAEIVPTELIKSTDYLHGGSILNEFFRFGRSEVVEFLKMLRALFSSNVVSRQIIIMSAH